MKYSIHVIVLAMLISMNAAAQGSENHLLWRISGKGLPKPSYLFGTMHLTDKRLFYFGDSLYHALEQTEGFAAEIDFNAFIGKYFDKLIGENGQQVFLKDRLNARELAEHKEKLEAKFKKPVDKITLADLKKEESRKRETRLKSGTMETFMDAYLLGLADKQGKWIGGIEDPEDQLGLEDAFDTESRIQSLFEGESGEKEQIEWMLQTYLKENLELIDRSNELWQGAKDLVLLRRNLKMASRIDSIASIRSCLFAIGAAHLPGDSGVVKLLRSRGYDVSPVISSRKIDPAKYTFKEVRKPWVDVWAKDSLYSIKMPMQPSPMPAMEDMPFDMLFYVDLPSNIAYFAASVPLRGTPSTAEDSIMANLARYYKKDAEAFSEKNIVWKGNRGKEFLIVTGEAQIRMQVFLPGGYVSMLFIAAAKKEALYSENAVRYFTSFKPDTARAAAAIARLGAEGWQETDYTADGFTVQVPSKFKRRKVDLGENGWKRFVVEGPNPKTQAYYAVTVDATKPGYYADNDSVFFAETETAMVATTQAEVLSSMPARFGQYPARDILLKVKKFDSDLQMRLLLISRGNRRYTVCKAFDPSIDKEGGDDRFFQTFRFLPFPTDHWQKTGLNDEFITYSPSEIAGGDTSEDGMVSYYAYDSLAAVSYNVTKQVFPAYSWLENDSLFFAQSIHAFVKTSDSIVWKKDIRQGAVVGVDAVIGSRDSIVAKRVKAILSGDTLYTIFSFMSPELIAKPLYNRFFDDFNLVHEAAATTVFINKTKSILEHLRSTDSATFQSAIEGIQAAPFTTADLPLLQEAMLSVYPGDASAEGYPGETSNFSLARRITGLDTAGTSVSFIEKNYPDLKGERAFIRLISLGILTRQHTAASYDLLGRLLADSLPEAGNYIYLQGLHDSLALSKGLFPNAFKAFNNKMLVWQLGNLALTLLDSSLLDLSVIAGHKNQLTGLASGVLGLKGDELKEQSYKFVPSIELLARLNDAEANVWLRKLAKSPALDVKEAALLGLVKNGEKLSTADFLPLARSDEYRSLLYDKLKEAGKMNLFPVDFLTQQLLGKSLVFAEANEDEPPVVVFVKEKTIGFKGVKKKFYLYKVSIGDYGEDYLGIAGPYSLNGKDLASSSEATGVYWDEPFDPKKTDAFFDAFLKQLSQPEEEEED